MSSKPCYHLRMAPFKKSIYPLALHARRICARLMNLYHRKSSTSAEIGILQVTKGYKAIALRKKDASIETTPRLYIVLNESGHRLLDYIFSFFTTVCFVFHFPQQYKCLLQIRGMHPSDDAGSLRNFQKFNRYVFFSTENVQIFHC